MRLIGYACKHPAPPLRLAYVPLGDVVVLLGPNDAGKSSALSAVIRDLSGGHFDEVDDEQAKRIGGVFYSELTPGELAHVVRATVRERQQLRSGHLPRPDSARPPWDAGMWEPKGLRDLELGDDPCATVVEQLRERKTRTPAEHERILDAISESAIVAFECAGRDQRGQRVWNAYWCLPAFGDLPKALAEALRGSDIFRFSVERARVAGERRYTRGHAGFYHAFHGSASHLCLADPPSLSSRWARRLTSHYRSRSPFQPTRRRYKPR
jgi:hypothetical protein